MLTYGYDEDRHARSVAAQWQSPGTIGRVLASFASGVPVEREALAADIAATITHDAPTGEDRAQLDLLAAWVETESSPLLLDSTDDTRPTLGPITRHRGIAGQYSYAVPVTYPGEDAATIEFVSSVYGGPVVMVSGTGAQTFVTDPERFGTFGPEWVRRFFGQGE